MLQGHSPRNSRNNPFSLGLGVSYLEFYGIDRADMLSARGAGYALPKVEVFNIRDVLTTNFALL